MYINKFVLDDDDDDEVPVGLPVQLPVPKYIGGFLFNGVCGSCLPNNAKKISNMTSFPE